MSKKKTLLFSFIPFIYLLLLLFQKDLAMLGDLGRHLKLGEVIVTCHCVPQTNLFSYTNPNFPIVNHEWLSEVIFYLTTVVFGLNGLLVLKMIIIVATSVLLYFVALKKGSLFWVTIFSLLCLTVFSTRFFVLPELFSYLFLSLFIFLIEKYKTSRKSNLLWFLPALEVLWVNMHIYFIIGIGMYGLFLLEEWLRHKKLDKQFFLVGASLIIGIFCNPSFAKGALLPFTIFHNYGLSVEENFSPFDVFNNLNTTSTVAYTLVLQVVVFEILVGLFLIGFFVIKQWGNIFS
ncbi:MAG TPA: hypothetical protein VE090_00190, partial [Methylomirabilota bacterium]|nr:hypothetical protein [Methylomirabilota bacterium]